MNDLHDSAKNQIGPEEAAFAVAVARRFVHDPDDAADVAQDALLLAYRHRASFRGQSRYRTWLYRIVVSAALSYLRRQRRRRATGLVRDDDASIDVPALDRSPEAVVGDVEAADLVRKELDRMGDKYSRVFRMRFEEDQSEADIARALGLSVPTVKIRTHRARRFLQKEVAGRIDRAA